MVLLEKIQKMVEVFKSNVFDAKFVNDEAELDGTPSVALEPRRGGSFIVSFKDKTGLQKIVGKDARLGKTITVLANLKFFQPSWS